MAGKVVVIERDMLKATAFRTLTSTAMVILFDFMAKRKIKTRKLKNGNRVTSILNNGEIEYCFSEAMKKGIPASSFNRGRDQLVRHGFLDISHAGSGGRKGDKTLYALSERWRKFGTPDFEYRERLKDKRKGVGFQASKKIFGVTSEL